MHALLSLLVSSRGCRAANDLFRKLDLCACAIGHLPLGPVRRRSKKRLRRTALVLTLASGLSFYAHFARFQSSGASFSFAVGASAALAAHALLALAPLAGVFAGLVQPVHLCEVLVLSVYDLRARTIPKSHRGRILRPSEERSRQAVYQQQTVQPAEPESPPSYR